MQLVQDQEFKASHVVDHTAVEFILPSHQQLEHHEVGEQYVRRVGCDTSSLRIAFLSGKAGKRRF